MYVGSYMETLEQTDELADYERCYVVHCSLTLSNFIVDRSIVT